MYKVSTYLQTGKKKSKINNANEAKMKSVKQELRETGNKMEEKLRDFSSR